MSIYPVRLSEWFPPGDKNHRIIKFLCSMGSCLHCKKKNVHWQKAIAHHSLPWGYGDLWCREKCFTNYYRKLKNK